jgi:predicted transcriptional regulator
VGNPRIGYSRKINIEPEVIDALRLIASARGVPVSAVIREALRQYVRRNFKRGAA